MERLFSNTDIINILASKGIKVKIMKYTDLINIRDIRDYLPVVLLYNSNKYYGHWTAIFQYENGTIEFFDSLGNMPDKEMKLLDKGLNPLLLHKLYQTGEQIEFNDIAWQKSAPHINTCGRWVIFRLINHMYQLDEFNHALLQIITEPYDEWIVQHYLDKIII